LNVSAVGRHHRRGQPQRSRNKPIEHALQHARGRKKFHANQHQSADQRAETRDDAELQRAGPSARKPSLLQKENRLCVRGRIDRSTVSDGQQQARPEWNTGHVPKHQIEGEHECAEHKRFPAGQLQNCCV